MAAFPSPPGHVTALENALNTDGGAAATNYVSCHWMTLLRGAYAGWKGSIRYKALASGFGCNIQRVTATRTPDRATIGGIATTYDFTDGNANAYLNLGEQPAWGGQYLTHQHLQPFAEIDLPFYTPLKFGICSLMYFNTATTNVGDYTNEMDFEVAIFASPTAVTGTSSRGVQCDFYVAAGEDFSFLYFVGAPTIQDVSLVAP